MAKEAKVYLRNFLIHEYFGVEVDEIWKTIKNDLPELKEKLKQIS